MEKILWISALPITYASCLGPVQLKTIEPYPRMLLGILFQLLIPEKLKLLFSHSYLALEIYISLWILVPYTETWDLSVILWKWFQDRGRANINVMTPWWKDNNDFTASPLQVHMSLPLAYSVNLFVLICNHCSWATLRLKRGLQRMKL